MHPESDAASKDNSQEGMISIGIHKKKVENRYMISGLEQDQGEDLTRCDYRIQ